MGQVFLVLLTTCTIATLTHFDGDFWPFVAVKKFVLLFSKVSLFNSNVWNWEKVKPYRIKKPLLKDKQAKSPTMHDMKENRYPNEHAAKKKTCQNLFLLVEILFDTLFL